MAVLVTTRLQPQIFILYIAVLGANVRFCRVVDFGWRLGRVYFLAFSTPHGDNRTQPLPPGWPVLPP
jgi:hypothetical protein